MARKYAAGVPTTRMITLAMTLVFSVTSRASTATSLPSWSTSVPGGTRRKMASRGSSRKARATAVQSTMRRPEHVPHVGETMKPNFLSQACPCLEST